MEAHDSDVPGTQRLVDIKARKLILIPAPSLDPSDPLNWPCKRKITALLNLLVYILFNALASGNLGSVLEPLSKANDLSLAALNAGTGYLFLLAGLGLFIWQPCAVNIGERPVYITSLLGLSACSVWAPFTTTPAQWYGRQIIMGFFGAPVEALPVLSMQDVYYTHERGYYISLYAFVLIGGNFIAPFHCGFINVGQGWQWVFYYPAMFCGAAAVLLFFTLEETILIDVLHLALRHATFNQLQLFVYLLQRCLREQGQNPTLT